MSNGVSAVLLAAGASRRMGPVNKLTLEVEGIPLLRRTALTYRAAPLTEVVVVLGHEAETAQGMIADLPLRIVTNPDYAQGQMTSVHRGLGALEQPGAGVMIGLADQPLIEPADLAELIRAFGEAGPRSVLVPTYAGTRGNPLILAWAHRAAILADVPQLGCKRLVTEHPEWVWPWPMANDHCVVDLDTSADWDHLAKRLSGPNQSAAEPLREA